MPNCRDPGGTVHVDPKVVVASEPALARVHPHADPKGPSMAPGVRGEGPLGRGGPPDGPARGREDCEEGIALRPDLDATAFRDGLPHQTHAVLLHLPIALAELPEKPCGPLDVGEQEGDGAGGEVAIHEPPVV